MDHGGFRGRGPLTKSEIYKTNRGKGIIEDELLNLLAVKMRIMLGSLTAKSFESKRTEALKRVWSEVRCTTQLCVQTKGHRKMQTISGAAKICGALQWMTCHPSRSPTWMFHTCW